MNIIAIECSSPNASIILCLNGYVCTELNWHTERNHDSHLFPALEEILQDLGGEMLDVILIGAGPGSYGGIRVAIAAGTGIQLIKGCYLATIDSWAQLVQDEVPAWACNSILHTDQTARQEYIIADAKRGGWTLRHPNGQIEVQSTEQILALQQSGATINTTEPAEKLPAMHALGITPQQAGLQPTALGLIKSWWYLDCGEQDAITRKEPSPIYVRPPHITQAKRKPWES